MVGPVEGEQACGEYGFGRMSDEQAIINALRLCEISQLLRGRHLMITAGPTREAIDPVRYISNRSSGKMGYALAEAGLMAGAQVTLVSGPTALQAPQGAVCYFVNTANEMRDAVSRYLHPGMVFIGAAAVSDYSIAAPADQKIKRHGNTEMTLDLVASPDILSMVVASKKAAYTVGFAAETHDVLKHAQAKLRAKHVDMLIANQVADRRGFDVDENQVMVLTHDGEIELPLNQKVRLASQIIAILATKLQN